MSWLHRHATTIALFVFAFAAESALILGRIT